MDISSLSDYGMSLQSVVSMAMLDKSMEFEKTASAQLLEGLDVGTPAAGEVGSILDVYA